MNWQDLIALAIVAAAAGYLVRRGWLTFVRKRAGGCGAGCGSCAAGSNQAEGKPLVTIGEIRRPQAR